MAAVSFDANRTLIHTPRVGEIYAEVLERHGIHTAPDRVEELVRIVWQELACTATPHRDRFASHPEGARGWWRRFLERLCQHLEEPAPGPFAAAELFERFARPEAWEVYPEAPGVVSELRGHDLRTAVVSNWDERLPGLLAALGLSELFDAVVYSAAIGVEKPHPAIFLAASEHLALPPASILHVGDSRRHDLEGALGAHFQALLLDRSGEGGDLESLQAVPELLGLRPLKNSR